MSYNLVLFCNTDDNKWKENRGDIMKKDNYDGVRYEPSRKNEGNENTKETNSFFDKHKYIIMLVTLFVFSCGIIAVAFQTVHKNSSYKKYAKSADVQSVEDMNEEYNKTTLGVIKEIDLDNNTVTFFNVKDSKDDTLKYNGSTNVLDKYDQVLTMAQIKIGEMVDLYYDNESNQLAILQISKDAWEYKGVGNLVIDRSNRVMTITNTKYKYTDYLVIANGDKLINLMDINEKDELIVKGYDKKIYSIMISKGHGYIKLSNYEDFIGGTIEIGYDINLPVVQDMLIVAREGTYKLTMTNGDFTGSKNINVVRDTEITVDMGDFIKEAVKKSSIDFKINPNGADLFIDGTEIDYTEPVTLTYGEHEVVVSLNGYSTYNGTLTVDTPSMNISIDLVMMEASDESEDTEDSSTEDSSSGNTSTEGEESTTDSDSENSTTNADDSDNSSNTNSNTSDSNNSESNSTNSENTSTTDNEASNSSSTTTDSEHTITVQKPAGAQVYFNGSLKGTAPVTFTKEVGTFTISLRKSGYVNKSYTVEVLDDDDDIYFSFPDLTVSTN